MKAYSCLLIIAACGEVKTTPDAPTPPGDDVTLTVTVAGSGRVTSTPAGLDCPGTCSATFAKGTQVTLATAVATGEVFTGWTRGCPSNRRACQLTLDADATVDAGFARESAKRWLTTAGSSMSFGDGRALSATGDGVAMTGSVQLQTTIGGKTATGGMFVARLDPATGQAAWLNNVANAQPVEIASDAEGNVIVAGFFNGMINLGAGNVASNQNSTDWFVAKYAAATGAHVWSKVIGGTLFDFATALAVAANGDVVVAGSFSRTVDFGGGPKTSAGGDTDDAFVARYAAADGKHVWSTTWGNTDNEQIQALVVDANGSVGGVGAFTGNLLITSSILLSPMNGSTDALLFKLDGASGNVLLAKALGGPSSGDAGGRIAALADGSLIVQGFYVAPFDIGGGPLRTDGGTFVSRFSSAGAHMWSFGTPHGISRVAVDSLDDIVLSGNFSGMLDFGNGTPLTSTGGADAYLAKLDAADGKARWTKRYGGTQTDQISALAVDSLDRIYASGTFRGIAEFDGENPTATGTVDIFVISTQP